ncbi:MAG: hypothetical protein LBS96_04105, partial [Oscillospiraceae bacterium]|nr:hypothetical protein [Oscillospiraceae bacterium]
EILPAAFFCADLHTPYPQVSSVPFRTSFRFLYYITFSWGLQVDLRLLKFSAKQNANAARKSPGSGSHLSLHGRDDWI